jgi:hypothetical protein
MLAIIAMAASLPAANAAPVPWSGAPWLALAKVGTQTCVPSPDERVFNLSIANDLPKQIDNWGISGDQTAWDFAPGTPLPLRLTWITQQNPPDPDMADSVRIYLRDANTGAQIGATVWQPSIPQTASSGGTIRTIHLDDNPMDGVYGTPRFGLVEIYAQLVGGADNGADTAGATAAGPNCGFGSYARGFLSSGLIKLYDNWNFANGTSWNGIKWSTTTNDSTKAVDVQSNGGRLYVNGSSARATAKTATMMDSDVTFTYQFQDRGSRSYLRPMLRAYGASGNSQMPNGYRLEFRSDSATVKLQSVVSGTSAPLDDFAYTMDTNPQKVRFQVIGSTIRAKVWPAGGSEPAAWSLEATNSSVTSAGVFQVSHNYSSGAHTVTVDDITIDQYSMPFEQQQEGFPACNHDSDTYQPAHIDANGLAWVCRLVEQWGDLPGDYYGWVLVH